MKKLFHILFFISTIFGFKFSIGQTYNASGTWTATADGTIKVQAWGGGGSGGCGQRVSGPYNYGGGGGSGGNYAVVNTYTVQNGDVITITIGAGGTASSSGNNGGTTTVKEGTTNIITVYGGKKGGNAPTNDNGAAGAINYTSAICAGGCSSETYGSAGTKANPGRGGGAGNGGGQQTTSAGTGTAPGGGGAGNGGTWTSNGVKCNGGSGAAGRVIITFTASCSSPTSPSFSAGATSLCAGGTSTYTASATNGTSVSYSILSGGATINSTSGVVSSVTSNFTVRATISNACGSTTVDRSVTVTSNTPSVSIVSNDADNTICNGTSVTFTATPTNGGTTPSYQWKLNGVNAGSNSTTYTTTSLTNGSTVSVVLTSNVSCPSTTTANSNTITTTVQSNTPSVSIVSNDADNTICDGTSVTFTATPTNGGAGPSYQWKLNGVNAGSNSTTYTTTTLTNGATVSVVMTSNITCPTSTTANSNTITTTVNAKPASPTTIDGSRCGTGTVSLGTSSQPNGTIKWYSDPGLTTLVGSVNTCIDANPCTTNWVTPSISSNTTYYVTRTSAAGCQSDAVTTTATINPNPTSAGFARTPSGMQFNGTLVEFTTTPAGGTAPYAYSWGSTGTVDVYTTPSNGSSGSFSTVWTNSSNAGSTVSYTMTVTDSKGCTVIQTMNPTIHPDITTPTGTSTRCQGSGNDTYTTTSTMGISANNNGLTDFVWSISPANAGTITSNAPTTVSGLTNGTATVVWDVNFNGTATISVYARNNLAVTSSPKSGTQPSSTKSITVNVTQSLTPSVSISSSDVDNTICNGGSVTFTASPTNGGTPSYQWKLNGTNVGGNTNTYTTTSLTNGSTVSVVLTSNVSCPSTTIANSNIITTTVNSSPSSLDYTTPLSYCVGQLITPINPTVNGSPTSYSISPSLPTGLGFNTTSGQISGTPSVLSNATNYTITATNSCGNTTKVINLGVSSPASGYGVNGVHYIWNGKNSTSFTTLSNWTYFNGTNYSVSTSVPGPTDDVIIGTGGCTTNNPVSTSNISVDSLIILGGASLTIDNNSTFTANDDVIVRSGASLIFGAGSNNKLKITDGNLKLLGTSVLTPSIGTVQFYNTTSHPEAHTLLCEGVNNKTFYNLTFDGDATSQDFYLSSNVNVTNTLTVSTNNFKLNNFYVDLGTTGTLDEGSGKRVYDDLGSGYIQRTINIGSSVNNLDPGNLGLIFSTNGNQLGTTIIKRYHISETLATNKVSIKRMYHVTPQFNGGAGNTYPSGLNLTLQMKYHDQDVVASGLQNSESTFRLYRRPDNSSTWTEQGGTVDANNNKVTISNFSQFSWVTVGETNSALPVEMSKFDGIKNGSNNYIFWVTSSEHNTSHFNVQKSRDCETWNTIVTLNAAGTSTHTIDYNVVDYKVEPIVNYYRLQQYDNDGVYETFGPISINNIKTDSVKTIIKYVNLNGQEIDPNKLEFMSTYIEVYNDGTIRKVIK